MDIRQAQQEVVRILAETLKAKGQTPENLHDETPLLGGGLAIDSLDLAGLVVNLTEATGKDPFANGFIAFRTIGELARLYAD
jgi:acyl carrier protein